MFLKKYKNFKNFCDEVIQRLKEFTYVNKKGNYQYMKRVKRLVHYWCHDMIEKKCLGKGVTVVVMDTGIAAHPDFRKKVLVFRDFVNGQNMAYDDNGHGTHVCGILAGGGIASNGTYAGMAPECDLIVLKVLDRKGNGKVEHVMQATQWVLANRKKYNIRIVNISVGMKPQTDEQAEAELVKGVEMLWDAGVVVVAAAGNLGPKEGSITSPGISRKIITVGSSNDRFYIDERGKGRENYSGRGPTKDCVCKPDLVAPGTYIWSCNAKYAKQKGRPYVAKSGTSMATPIVSGAIADLLSKYPDMSNIEVKLRLRESSIDLGLSHNRQGWGMLSVEKLLK